AADARSTSRSPTSISRLARASSRSAIPRATKVDAEISIGNACIAKRKDEIDIGEVRLAFRNVFLVRGRLISVRREVGFTAREIAHVNREVESVFFDVNHTQPQLHVMLDIPQRDGDPAAVTSGIVGRTLSIHPLGASPIDG